VPQLQFDSITAEPIKNYKKLPDGSLVAWLRVARTGELDYGDQKQYVPPDTLFDNNSMRSLVGVPVTLEHPPGMILNLANRQKYSIGTVMQEVVQETHDGNPTGYLTASALIWHEGAIQELEKGNFREVSSGYFANTEPMQDSRTLKQVQRTYNHIALTQSGRAGAEVKILMDTKESVAELVALHHQYRDSLVRAGIEPDYSWDKLTLLRNAVTASCQKDASSLSLSDCMAIMDFMPKPQEKPAVPTVDAQTPDIYSEYMLRLTNAYKKL
jgi:hypothetical protein